MNYLQLPAKILYTTDMEIERSGKLDQKQIKVNKNEKTKNGTEQHQEIGKILLSAQMED